MKLDKGDKFTMEFEVTETYSNGGCVAKGPEGTRKGFNLSELGAATNVIRAPVEPAAGQVWENSTYIYKIIFIDDIGALVEYQNKDRHTDSSRIAISRKYFKGMTLRG